MQTFLTTAEFTTGTPVTSLTYLFLVERPFSFHFLNLVLDHHKTFRFPFLFICCASVRIRAFLSSAKFFTAFPSCLQASQSKQFQTVFSSKYSQV